MSYDLYFWREEKPLDLSPGEVCDLLADEQHVEGIVNLPIDQVKQRFAETFPGINDCLSYLDWEGEGSYFQVHWPPDPVNALIVNCGYQLLESPDTMNRIMDVAQQFGCALYDPQVGQRFEQPDLG